MYQNEETSSKFGEIFMQLLFVVLFIFLLVWLFPTKGYVTNYLDDKLETINDSVDDKLKPIYDRFFEENIETMKETGLSYFTANNLPKNNQTKTITLEQMLEKQLLVEFKDGNNNKCNTSKSKITMTNKNSQYQMKVTLSCTDQTDSIMVYIDKNNIKTVTNNIKEETQTQTTKPIKLTTKTVNNVYSCQYSKQIKNTSLGKYSSWSNWTENEVTANKYTDVEEKTVIINSGTKITKNELKESAVTNTQYICNSKYINAGVYNEYNLCKYIDNENEFTENPLSQTTYTCGSEYDNAGVYNNETTCIKTEMVQTKVYTKIKYYRYRTRETINKNAIKYKWSNCNNSTLINNGYSLTGKKKIS